MNYSKNSKIYNTYKKLLSNYGYQGWWPLLDLQNNKYNAYHPNNYKYPKTEKQKQEIIIGAILTQNTTWVNAYKSILNLEKNKLLSAKQIYTSSLSKIQKSIKSSRYFKQKSKYLKNISFFLLNFKKIPTPKQLLNIKGVGLETAHSILLYAYKQPFFIIDAYTKRFLSRLINFKLTSNSQKNYKTLQKEIVKRIPNNHEIYNEFHALIVYHCKKYCLKTNPKCQKCFLRKICKYY